MAGEGMAMKKLEAIISTFKLDAVKNALQLAGVAGMTISEVGAPVRRPATAEFRGREYRVDVVPAVKVEVVVDDGRVSQIVAALRMAARADGIVDDKIVVLRVLEAVRVRTGERGSAAL
jgi:nitrogen regulatory protein PII